MMGIEASLTQWIMGLILILSALGVILSRKPIYSSLFFLLSLILLAVCYFQLSAEFIAVMQILVYAGAILVIFVFVIVLFQDAYQQLARYQSQSSFLLLTLAITCFVVVLGFFGVKLFPLPQASNQLIEGFGSVGGIGKALYLDFFFPFEAVVVFFLVAIIGSLYIAKREG